MNSLGGLFVFSEILLNYTVDERDSYRAGGVCWCCSCEGSGEAVHHLGGKYLEEIARFKVFVCFTSAKANNWSTMDWLDLAGGGRISTTRPASLSIHRCFYCVF